MRRLLTILDPAATLREADSSGRLAGEEEFLKSPSADAAPAAKPRPLAPSEALALLYDAVPEP
jgi:hypothetical protein